MKARIILKSFDDLFPPMFSAEPQATPTPTLGRTPVEKPPAGGLASVSTDSGKQTGLFNAKAHEEKSFGGRR